MPSTMLCLVIETNNTQNNNKSNNKNKINNKSNNKEEQERLVFSDLQKTCASSCWNLRTRVSPVRAPLYSFRCSTPKSARRSGSSLYDRALLANITQCPAHPPEQGFLS